MFSMEQKKKIAAEIEKLLLSFNHPEMPTANPSFHLRIDGKQGWNFADIDPNWTFDSQQKMGVNPHNEAVAEQMKGSNETDR